MKGISGDKHPRRARRADKYAQELRNRQTPAEQRFYDLLKQAGVVCQRQKIVMIPGSTFFIIDFYIKDRHLCIELDGGYHQTTEQQAKDQSRDAFLIGKGYRVWRMTNEQANALTPESLKTALAAYPVVTVGKIRILPPAEEPIRYPRFKKKIEKKPRKRVKKPRPCKYANHLDAIIARKRSRPRFRRNPSNHSSV